jgi:hypothetical protein
MKNQIWGLSLHKCSKNNLITIKWGSLENTDQFITPKIALSNPNLAQASRFAVNRLARAKEAR